MDIAVVIEPSYKASRALWGTEPGDLNLMGVLVGPSWSYHVLMPHIDVLAELDLMAPRLVLAFGTRAATVCVPGFRTMSIDHGKPVLGPSGKWAAMAVWSPAVGEWLGTVAADLAKVEALLFDGLVELMQSAPAMAKWPKTVGFLAFVSELKTGKCRLCGGGDIASFKGEGLQWKLCVTHAWLSAEWAALNLAILREHRDIAVADSAAARADHIAVQMQAVLQSANERWLSPPEPVDGASDGMEQRTATGPDAPCGDTAGSGSSAPASPCVDGASGPSTSAAATVEG